MKSMAHSFVYRQDGFELSLFIFHFSFHCRLPTASSACIIARTRFAGLPVVGQRSLMQLPLYMITERFGNTPGMRQTHQSPKSMTLIAIIGQTFVHSPQLSHLS